MGHVTPVLQIVTNSDRICDVSRTLARIGVPSDFSFMRIPSRRRSRTLTASRIVVSGPASALASAYRFSSVLAS